MTRTHRAVLLAAVTVWLTLPGATSGQRATYSGIVVFGTSLSDSGNAFALRGGTATPPDYSLNPLLIPNAPYARGGHHFSNGATWIEQFARSLGLAGSVRPAYASSSPNATNYAVGAARAYDDPADVGNVNLADQVNQFLADAGGVAPSEALYVIEMGSNDVRDALSAYIQAVQSGMSPQQAQQTAGAILARALQSIEAAIRTLYAAGAREFLVWTVPDVGLTPAIQSLGPGVVQLATALTTSFNALLQQRLLALQSDPALTGISIQVLDAFALLHQISADPAQFGLTNTTDACITPNEPPFFCQTPDEYLFWDGIHPTRATHALTAREAARVLALR